MRKKPHSVQTNYLVLNSKLDPVKSMGYLVQNAFFQLIWTALIMHTNFTHCRERRTTNSRKQNWQRYKARLKLS